MESWVERNSPADIVESAAGQNIPSAPSIYNIMTNTQDINLGAHGRTPEEKPKALTQRKVFLMSKALGAPITGQMIELGSNILIANEVEMKARSQGKSELEIIKAKNLLK
jgi:hypothetical protein